MNPFPHLSVPIRDIHVVTVATRDSGTQYSGSLAAPYEILLISVCYLVRNGLNLGNPAYRVDSYRSINLRDLVHLHLLGSESLRLPATLSNQCLLIYSGIILTSRGVVGSRALIDTLDGLLAFTLRPPSHNAKIFGCFTTD